jgi:hypothetical protein
MLRPRSRLHVEMLEDRSVPAVTVLGFNTADVSITGDNQSNDIFVTLSGQGIEVHANGATTLTLDPSTPAGWVVQNTPTLIILNPNGPNQQPTLDNLHISMMNGDDKVSIGGCVVNNNLVIRDHPGGNDTVIMDNTRVGQNAFIYLTSGNDKVFITSSTFGNNVIVNTAGGNDLVRFIPGLVTVGGNLGIYTGGGNDIVRVDPGTAGTATLHVVGNTLIRTHIGDDQVRFGTPTTLGSPTAVLNATVIDTGAGKDRIFMRDALMSLLIALLGDDDDAVQNNWGSEGVTVGFGSLLDGGNHMTGDSLPVGWTAPANLTVVNFP